MRKALTLALVLLLVTLLFAGAAWAKPGKGHGLYRGNDAGLIDKPGTMNSKTEDRADAEQDEDEDEANNDEIEYATEDEDEEENEADDDEIEKDAGEIEYTTEDGLKVEIENGKIEIKGNGFKFKMKNGKVEYKSENGKIEINREGIKVKGNVLKEYKQKLENYKKLIDHAIEAGEKFSDIEEHWASSSIEKMSAIGLFKGYEDGTFRPDNSITQAEAVALIVRIASKNETGDEDQVDESELEDVPGWARAAVREAAKHGFINLNRFHSHVQASRAQTAVMIAKALGLEPVDVTDMPFRDGILISPEDVGYIMALYEQGIIKGTPDGKFNPNSTITRAEIAAIMERIIAGQENDEDSQTGEDNAAEDESTNEEESNNKEGSTNEEESTSQNNNEETVEYNI